MRPPLFPDRPFRAAAIQMCSGPKPERNLEQARDLMAEAARAGAELVVLPENALHLRVDDEAPAPLLFPESPELSALQQAAREGGFWLLVGSLPEASADPARPFNTSVLLDAGGRVRARYRKIHLFSVRLGASGAPSPAASGAPSPAASGAPSPAASGAPSPAASGAPSPAASGAGLVLDERRTITPGDRPVVAVTPFGGVGLSICYDLRFPELYRGLVAAGATVLAVPSAFTRRTGRVHWRLLVRARAVENLSFVVAAAQTGHHGGGRHSWGHGLIVGPWGDELAAAGAETGVIAAEIDPRALREARGRLRALDDLRLAVPRGVDLQAADDLRPKSTP